MVGRCHKFGLAKMPDLPRVCARFMTTPSFIELQSTLLNLAYVESCYVEDATLHVAIRDEVHEFEYEDGEQADAAMLELRTLLATGKMLVGSVT
ncbi:MAG: hypothetical protein RLZZ265_1405 [Verrucomicrobiota bacterium]|jgi:hypothetical protein